MTARPRYRYSGALTIAITLLDGETGDGRARYRCRISRTGERAPLSVPWVGEVNSPAWRSYSDDSSEAFNRTAQAALAFAEHDGWPVDSYAGYGEQDYEVSAVRPR